MRPAVFPKDCSEALATAMAVAGLEPVPVGDLGQVSQSASADWSSLIIELGDEPMRRLRLADTIAEETGIPILVVADPAQFQMVARAAGVTDFITHPPNAAELGLRVNRHQREDQTEGIIRYNDLELNRLTYQARLGDSALDLTFMEYELLRFLLERQKRVWSREQLLSRVWGYDYFGGARTVDVHVRRLRAKLGEERAGWITTVRSVGYRFG